MQQVSADDIIYFVRSIERKVTSCAPSEVVSVRPAPGRAQAISTRRLYWLHLCFHRRTRVKFEEGKHYESDTINLEGSGGTLYQQKIRAEVETADNIGKMVIIDVETGEYAVNNNGLTSARHLQARRPDAQLYGIRIGYKVSEALGGVLERVGS